MSFKQLCKPWEHRLSRRQWLSGSALATAMGAAGMGAAGMSNLAQSAVAKELKKKNKQVLFIWLDGGISQLESWDPKPGTEFGGPFRAIPTTVAGIHLSELLPRTAKQMHHLAIIRSLCTKDNSHSAGVARIQRGDPKDRGVVYPFFGSAVARLLDSDHSGLPPYVWIKPGGGGFMHQDAGFLGPQYGALAFGDGKPPENLLRHASLSDSDISDRLSLRELADSRYADRHLTKSTTANRFVFSMANELMKRQDLFDTRNLLERDIERYGTHDLGRHMLQARKMLEAGVSFVKVNSYGWDSHGDCFNGSHSLISKFDQAFSAIIEDLAASEMLENVLVIAISEFGRTPRINGHLGRDHWPDAWSAVMAGCGIKRGVAVGQTNESGTFVTSEEYDIGHMFHTWFTALGIDPHVTEYINNGQPLPIAHDDCHAVGDLLI